MDTAITLGSLIEILGMIVAFVAGIGGIIAIIKWITSIHDKREQYDDYDKKIEQIQAEQCMITYCMMATLDGLHQLGCNGEVTKARSKLDKWMNKQAHGVSNEE